MASPDSTIEEVVNSSNSSDSTHPDIIAMMSKFLSSTIQTFTRRDVTPTNVSFQETDKEDGREEGEKEDEGEERGEDHAN